MERVFNKAIGHDQAHEWDVEQQKRMTPEERLQAARVLKDRHFPADAKDIREWHRER